MLQQGELGVVRCEKESARGVHLDSKVERVKRMHLCIEGSIKISYREIEMFHLPGHSIALIATLNVSKVANGTTTGSKQISVLGFAVEVVEKQFSEIEDQQISKQCTTKSWMHYIQGELYGDQTGSESFHLDVAIQQSIHQFHGESWSFFTFCDILNESIGKEGERLVGSGRGHFSSWCDLHSVCPDPHQDPNRSRWIYDVSEDMERFEMALFDKKGRWTKNTSPLDHDAHSIGVHPHAAVVFAPNKGFRAILEAIVTTCGMLGDSPRYWRYTGDTTPHHWKDGGLFFLLAGQLVHVTWSCSFIIGWWEVKNLYIILELGRSPLCTVKRETSWWKLRQTTEDIHQLQQDTPAHNELRAPMYYDKKDLDHGRKATAKTNKQGRGPPGTQAPPGQVPGDTAKEQAAKPQHDPIFNSKTIYTQLPHAVTCCSRLKMAKFYKQMHMWNSTPVLSLIREHGLPRMTPGLPALWHFSRTSVVHQCRVETSVHYPSSDQKCEDFQGSFQIIYGAKYEQDLQGPANCQKSSRAQIGAHG